MKRLPTLLYDRRMARPAYLATRLLLSLLLIVCVAAPGSALSPQKKKGNGKGKPSGIVGTWQFADAQTGKSLGTATFTAVDKQQLNGSFSTTFGGGGTWSAANNSVYGLTWVQTSSTDEQFTLSPDGTKLTGTHVNQNLVGTKQ